MGGRHARGINEPAFWHECTFCPCDRPRIMKGSKRAAPTKARRPPRTGGPFILETLMPRFRVHPRPIHLTSRLAALAIGAVLSAPGISAAADIVIKVSGATEPFGKIGCTLFTAPDGFPLDSGKAQAQQWLPAEAKVVSCRFANVAAGRYAVAVGHDLNGNQRVDTNMVGMPTEQWGVSRNARPTLRAPRFDEAVFEIAADAPETVLEIKIAK